MSTACTFAPLSFNCDIVQFLTLTLMRGNNDSSPKQRRQHAQFHATTRENALAAPGDDDMFDPTRPVDLMRYDAETAGSWREVKDIRGENGGAV